jgi:hypothetical protein
MERELRKLPAGSTVISGGARGADTMAEMVAKELGLSFRCYRAEWGTYGLKAGPMRNQRMLDEGKPDVVMAFHQDIGKSRGTADMIRRAKRAGVRVELYSGVR